MHMAIAIAAAVFFVFLDIPAAHAAWIYKQSTGEIFHKTSVVVSPAPLATGYAGVGSGKNNPALECQGDVGPLPQGRYVMTSKSAVVTKDAIVLAPGPGNTLCNGKRNNFLIHGDRILEAPLVPGTASNGCIILPRDVRLQIWDSGDRDLEVVP